MKKWYEHKNFERFLEIVPGVLAWSFLASPFILSYRYPIIVGIFILSYAFYWLVKSINISRHLWTGYLAMKRNSAIDWLEVCKKTTNLKALQKYWEQKAKEDGTRFSEDDYLFVKNICQERNILNWEEIKHVVIFAVSNESKEIIEPSIKALFNCNYPMKNIMVVIASEARFPDSVKAVKELKKKYEKKFASFDYYTHEVKPGEVVGKGPNITFAGKGFWKEYAGKIDPKKTLVTNLDADHIVDPQYFGRLAYLYAVDPNREKKSYQPVALLFNNIWDATPANRIAAISSSFWQIIEGMRPFRLRTFAAHTQNLDMLLTTDFWGTHTIVEDGHQYWRSYFALNGNHAMVPMLLPVYQDAVLGESLWGALKNQYKQKRRWAWGVTDFPFVVINSLRHREIPLLERFIQVFRIFSGHFTWSTSAFFLATAWIPLVFNQSFQDTVLAHNIASFSSQMLRLAWIGLVLNVWISLIMMPPRPARYGKHKYLELVAQWLLSPPYTIFLSSLPALDSQTSLMLGRRCEVFWITPKIRKHVPKFDKMKDLG